MDGRNTKTRRILLSMLLTVTLLSGVFSMRASAIGSRNQSVKSATNQAAVLFISSYSLNWESVPSQIDGIKDALGNNVYIDYVFMDTKSITNDTAEIQTRNALQQKMPQVGGYDLVIAGDDAALDFVLKYQYKFFNKTPIVFEGINDVNWAKKVKDKNKYVTGIVEEYDLEDTVSLAKSILPNAETIVGITDSSNVGNTKTQQFHALAKTFPDLKQEIVNCSDLSLKEIQEKVGSYDKNTILLYLNFQEDGEGNHYTISQSTQILVDAANAMIFRGDETGIENGLAGGCIIRFYDMGHMAGRMAMAILDGKSPADMPLESVPTYNVLNARTLARFSVSESALPQNVELIYEEKTYVEENIGIISAFLLFTAIAFVIIFLLVRDNRNRKALYSVMVQKEEENTRIINSIPTGIGCFELTERALSQIYINDSFYSVMQTRKEAFEEYFGEYVYNAAYEDDLKAYEETKRMLLDGVDSFQMARRFWLVNRTRYKWISVAGQVMERKNGRLRLYCTYTDMDELEHNKQIAEESKTSMELAIDNIGMLFFEYYPDQDFVFFGENHDRWGIPAFLSNFPESFFELKCVYADDENTMWKLFMRCKEGENNISTEARLYDRNSGNRLEWYRFNLAPLLDADGKRVKVIGMGVNITAQKSAEYNYKGHMDSIVKMNPNAVSTYRLNISRNICENGYSSVANLINLGAKISVDTLFAKASDLILDPKEKEQFREFFELEHLLQKYDKGERKVEMEHRMLLEPGRNEWLLTSLEMMENPETREIQGIAYQQNINNKKIKEQVINEVLRYNFDNLYYVDKETQEYIVYRREEGNTSVGELKHNFFDTMKQYILDRAATEGSLERISGITWESILQQLENRDEYSFYVSIHMDDGSRKRKKFQFVRVEEENNKIFAMEQDITEIYETEEKRRKELSEALEDAHRANKAKTEFFSRMSHDIRTPMNGVLGMTTLALEEKNFDVVREYLHKIDSSGQFLLGLINDILDVSKIDSGKMELFPEPYTSQEMEEYLDVVIGTLCRNKGVNFSMSIDFGEYPVMVDKLRFNQIYCNLLSNSVKFTKVDGTVEIGIAVKENLGDQVVLETMVKDNGCGMSKEFMEHMFEPFSQEQSHNKSGIIGTGLGLAIVNNMVEMMNGQLEVESEQEDPEHPEKLHGSRFTITVTLPVVKTEAAAKSVAQSELKDINILEYDFGGKNLLLCEDNDINAMIITRILNKSGFTVDRAENGKIGVDKFVDAPKGTYEAILMDIRMPEMSGLEATEAIRKYQKEQGIEMGDPDSIPIIAMTANAFDEDVQQAKDAGMNRHLSKPIDREKVLKTLYEYTVLNIRD